MRGKGITFFIIDDPLNKELDMSNDNEIYPLKEFIESDDPPRRQRSVNQRLAPIFKALLDNPDGWREETCLTSLDRVATSIVPRSHHECNHFRLVRKRKTVTVEIPVPERLSAAVPVDVCGLVYTNESDCREAEKSILKAMEGK